MKAFSIFVQLWLIPVNAMPMAAFHAASQPASADMGDTVVDHVDYVSASPHHSLDVGLGSLLRSESVVARLDAQGSVFAEGVDSHHAPQMHRKKPRQPSPIEADMGTVLSETGVKQSKAPESEHKKAKSETAPQTKPKEDGLPAYLQILLGALTTLIIMTVYSCAKSRLTSPVPRSANSERLEVVLQEALERVDKLKSDLDGHFAERVPLEDAGDPEEAAAREAERELDEKYGARAKEIHKSAARLAQQKEALLAGAVRVQNSLKESLHAGREHLEEFTQHETADLYAKVQSAVTETSVPEWQPPEWLKQEDDDFIKLPPVVNLVQGAFASTQIRRIRYMSGWTWWFEVVMIVIFAVVIAEDWERHCADKFVWVWQIGALTITSLDFICHTFIMRHCNKQLDHLKQSRLELEKANASQTGSPLLDMFANLRRGSRSYFAAYFKLQEIAESRISDFVQLLAIVSLLWGAYGLWLSVHDIIIDTFACDANLALAWMHTYSFFYVLLLTWTLLGVCSVLLSSVSSSRFVSVPLIQLAKKIDDESLRGFPVVLTLIESFVLRNSSASIHMGMLQARSEVREYTVRIKEMEDKLTDRRRAVERLAELRESTRTQDDFMERCQSRLAAGFEEAKPLVGLIAANVRTEVPTSTDIDYRLDETASSSTRYNAAAAAATKDSVDDDPDVASF